MVRNKSPDFLGKTEKLFQAITNLAKTQTGAQDEVVDIITKMCDSLETASDLIIAEISRGITDINRARGGGVRRLQRCFQAQAMRFSQEKLSKKLKAGKVCGDLRKLGKRFGNPLSRQAIGAQTLAGWLCTVFRRSPTMKRFVDDLYFDERRYINDFRDKLRKIVICAEKAASYTSVKKLENEALSLRKKLDGMRTVIRDKMRSLRTVADACIDKLP